MNGAQENQKGLSVTRRHSKCPLPELVLGGAEGFRKTAGVPQVSPGLRELGSYRRHDSTDVLRGFGSGPRFAKTGQTWGTPRSRLSAHLQGYTYGRNVGHPPDKDQEMLHAQHM
jgi:hypothetical protein